MTASTARDLKMEVSLYMFSLRTKLIHAAALYYYKIHRKRKNRKIWVSPILLENIRKSKGAGDNLMVEMRLNSKEKFKNYFRMEEAQFTFILNLIKPSIEKLNVVRNSVPSEIRLALTLRFLASGDSMVSTAYNFRVGASTVSEIIRETCNALWNNLKSLVFITPSEESWLHISREFESQWNFPHCIGAVDDKHVIIQAPAKSGSVFYNYKGSHSIVLMAICSPNYEFTFVDIGAQGRQSDGGIFKTSQMGRGFGEGLLNVPSPMEVYSGGPILPFMLVGDDAFQLSHYLLKPYPRRTIRNQFGKQVFNYRLSRARRTIENSFGILASRWRIYRKPIIASLETAEAIIKATVVLHNLLIQKDLHESVSRRKYCPTGFADTDVADGTLVPGRWRQHENITGAFVNIGIGNQNNYSASASDIRNEFTEYFMTDGSVHFQWQRAIE